MDKEKKSKFVSGLEKDHPEYWKRNKAEKKSKFGFGLEEVRKSPARKYKDRLTEDQKIYRILKILSNGGDPLTQTDLLKKVGTDQPTKKPKYWDKLLEKKFINRDFDVSGSGNIGKFTIGDYGTQFIDTLIDIKTKDSKHPIFEFNFLNMTTSEENDERKKENFELKMEIQPRQNNEKGVGGKDLEQD